MNCEQHSGIGGDVQYAENDSPVMKIVLTSIEGGDAAARATAAIQGTDENGQAES
jgi:hypothetical protein